MSILTVRDCETAKEFLDLLTPWNTPFNLSNYVFRGHSDENYKLHPNILRKQNNPDILKLANIILTDGKYKEPIGKYGVTNIKNFHSSCELTILRRFYRSANENGLYVPNSKLMSSQMEVDGYVNFSNLMKTFKHSKWLNSDSIEIAALAQHHGLPTRLIDWSYNQFVASFFASNLKSPMKEDQRISVWMLNYTILSTLFASPLSDIKIFSPHYQWNHNAKSQRGLFTYIESTHDKDEFAILEEFFDGYIETGIFSDDPKFNSVKTDYRTLDIALEDAINEYNSKKTEKINASDLLVKITLPASEATTVNYFLRQMRVSEATIFPGYNGVVDDLQSILRF